MTGFLRRRGTLIANLAVLVVLVVGVYHVGFNILRLQIGRDPYTVHLRLATSGGLFERSEVAYRGKLVGNVTDVRLDGPGVIADLRLDEGTRIPADLDAAVSNLSAAGEQFVDLRPRSTAGPYLAAGSVIPAERTSTPVTTAVLVRNVAELLDQVGNKDLNTVVDELALALDGTGPELARLVDDSEALIGSLSDALPSTINVLRNGRTNLDTANELTGEFQRFTRELRTLTSSLRRSDPAVRELLAKGPAGIADLDKFVTTLNTPVAALLGNLITPGNLITARLPALNGLLIAFPQATGALKTTVRDGDFRVALHLADNPVCDYTGPRRTPIDPTRVPPDLDRVCTDDSPRVGVRGAQNAPRTSPSGPGSTGAAQNSVGDQATQPAPQRSALLAVGGYDPVSRTVALPDGSRVAVSPVRGSGTGSAAVSLLLSLLRS